MSLVSRLVRVFAVNVRGLLYVSQIVANAMVDKGIKGSIVHISSQVSKRTLENHTVYAASKATVDSISASMAQELGKHGIRVNTVNPTVVLTEMGKMFWKGEAKQRIMLNKIPLDKFAKIEDVVWAVLFLLSDKSAMTTGANLPVEGGFLINS